MYTKGEREGMLWEFHRSGMSVAEACRRLPLFPNEWNPRRWLRMEEAGELAAREMPDRASRMHCAHGEGSPAYRRARPAPGPRHARTRREGGPTWLAPRGATGAPTCRRTRPSGRGCRGPTPRGAADDFLDHPTPQAPFIS